MSAPPSYAELVREIEQLRTRLEKPITLKDLPLRDLRSKLIENGEPLDLSILALEWPPPSSGGGAPSGPAGGVLSGTYPNPAFAVDMATQAELDTEAAARAAGDTGVGASNVQVASYTLVLGDAGKSVEMNAAGATVTTVPPNATVAFPVGTVIEVVRFGAGTVTIAAGAGVTIRSRGSLLAIGNQYGSVALRKRATDEWVLVGDLA